MGRRVAGVYATIFAVIAGLVTLNDAGGLLVAGYARLAAMQLARFVLAVPFVLVTFAVGGALSDALRPVRHRLVGWAARGAVITLFGSGGGALAYGFIDEGWPRKPALLAMVFGGATVLGAMVGAVAWFVARARGKLPRPPER